MKYQIIIRPEAEGDLHEAFFWYEKQEKGLGPEFLHCVDVSLSSINRSPKIFFSMYKGVRRALIRKFPYGIFFVLDETKIIVLAVLHVRRDPKHWKKRR